MFRELAVAAVFFWSVGGAGSSFAWGAVWVVGISMVFIVRFVGMTKSVTVKGLVITFIIL